MAKEAVNTFNGGMNLDLNSIVTPNNVLTNCLNGTYVTFDGNEFVLQNDMGNGKVETAKLPSGYIPVGIKEYGGIIYVASVNPLNNKCQLGSFPSPERNFTTDELSQSPIVVQTSDFYTSKLNTMYIRKELLNSTDKLRPGDKFIIGSENLEDYSNLLSDYNGSGKKLLKLHLAILDDDNNISYIEDDINKVNGYWVFPLTGNPISDSEILSGENSNYPYNIFKSKTSGKLLLIAELESPKTFNASLDVTNISNTDLINIDIPFSWDEDEEEKANLEGIKIECSHGSDSLLRYVDITNSYKISIEEIVKNSELFSYNITPYTKFGTIDYLSKRGSINLEYIGSGNINLVEWRYYADNNSVTLSWGLEAYPRYGYNITDVNFTFIDVANKAKQNIYHTKQRSSYNGNFTEYIPFDQSNVYFDSNEMMLVPKTLYVVRIEVVSFNGTNTLKTITYRLMYTSSTFNDKYLENKISDLSSESVNATLDLNIIDSSGNLTNKSKSILANTIRDTDIVNPKDTMSYLYSEYSKDIDLTVECKLKKNTSNQYAGDIDKNEVEFNLNIDPLSITVLDYQSNLIGDTALETFINAINPTTSITDTISNYDSIDKTSLDSNSNIKLNVTGSSTSTNTWSGSIKTAIPKKLTCEVESKTQSGTTTRVIPYIEVNKLSASEINNLFGHAIDSPTLSDTNYHFNKMIAMISGRHSNDKSRKLAGYGTYSGSTWQLTSVVESEKDNYSGDLLTQNTSFSNDFKTTLSSCFGDNPIHPVLRGCGKDKDGGATLRITSNLNSSWTFGQGARTDEPDVEGYGLDCNRWSFVLWKTTTGNYIVTNNCIVSISRDGKSGYYLLNEFMKFLTQLYIARTTSYYTQKYVPSNIYYQNSFTSRFKYNITGVPTNITGNSITTNILINDERITETVINNIITSFNDVSDDSTTIKTIPSLNNLQYIISVPSNFQNEFYFDIKTDNTDSILSNYTTVDISLSKNLIAEDINGNYHTLTGSNNNFTSNQIYWFDRSLNKFYSLQEKNMQTYKDSFYVDSSGIVKTTRSSTVDLGDTTYSNLSNLLSIDNTYTERPYILINEGALLRWGTTKRISNENNDDWFRIYDLKATNKLAICT